MKYIIGVDIGGTKINTILVDKNFKKIRKIRLPTEAKKGRSMLINNILDMINFVSSGIPKQKIIGIGIGVPGFICENKILDLPNIPKCKNLNLKNIVEKKTKLKTLIENDSNCMALAEFLFKYNKLNNLVCLTIGTGVGSGIIINKKLYTGKGNAAELGHMIIQQNGLKCNCGNKGCLEEYISARAIVRTAKKLKLKETNVIKIQQLAKKGNKKSIRVYEIIGKYLAIGLSNIIKILDPDIILIGGGVSNSKDLLLKPALKELKKYTNSNTKIKIISLGEDSGAIGAASLFKLK
jgi:glucokinase